MVQLQPASGQASKEVTATSAGDWGGGRSSVAGGAGKGRRGHGAIFIS